MSPPKTSWAICWARQGADAGDRSETETDGHPNRKSGSTAAPSMAGLVVLARPLLSAPGAGAADAVDRAGAARPVHAGGLCQLSAWPVQHGQLADAAPLRDHLRGPSEPAAAGCRADLDRPGPIDHLRGLRGGAR